MLDYDVLGAFSPYLVAFLVAYLLTEGIKIISIVVKYKDFRWREFFKSGGMPSSHSADVTALAVVVGMIDGFDSAMFGLAAGFAAIVMYDAMHVRRAVGDQGEALRKLIDRDHEIEGALSNLMDDTTRKKLPKPYFSRGHKPSEVVVGAAVGIVVGVAVAWLSVQ